MVLRKVYPCITVRINGYTSGNKHFEIWNNRKMLLYWPIKDKRKQMTSSWVPLPPMLKVANLCWEMKYTLHMPPWKLNFLCGSKNRRLVLSSFIWLMYKLISRICQLYIKITLDPRTINFILFCCSQWSPFVHTRVCNYIWYYLSFFLSTPKLPILGGKSNLSYIYIYIYIYIYELLCISDEWRNK